MHIIINKLAKGESIIPDKMNMKNTKKREFCKKFDGYGEFCAGKKKINSLIINPFT